MTCIFARWGRRARRPASLLLIGALGVLPMADAARSQASEAAPHPVVLHYLNAPKAGAPLLRPPKLGLTIGGRRRPAVMDSGSTGIVVSASTIPDLAGLPDLGPARLVYSSSGRIMIGRFVRTAVTLTGADGIAVTTRPLAVLAVERIECLKSARNCRPGPPPDHVAMVGIGFGREKDGQRSGTPEKNPFLNLPGMASADATTGTAEVGLGRGYVITRTGVQLGLRDEDGAGFARVALARGAMPGEWQAARACFSLDQRTPPACGSLLLDTGVIRSFLTVPEAQLSGLLAPDGRSALADGVRVDILPAEGASEPRYGFAVGNRADPAAPEAVIVVPRPGAPAFFNTSVRVLNTYDYLFDADKGVVGFRRRPR